jgi:AbrB family looped-hinge helix DNA binding protein
MPIVTVKNKYQIVIPQQLREQVGIAIGDILEAKAEKGRIIFQPKALVDRGIAESIEEFKAGRAYGPFETHKELLASLHKEAKKPGRKGSKRPRR